MRASTERYEDEFWYDWCVRTGRGDTEAAWKEYQRLLRAQRGENSAAPRTAEIQHLIFLGQRQKAYALAKKESAFIGHPIHALAVAMLAEELGHKKEAKALVDAAKSSIEQNNSYEAASYKPIAELLGQVMLAEDVSEENIERLLAENEAGDGSVLAYLGWHLANRGEKELAKKYLSSLAGSRHWTHHDILYAQVKLRELGVRVDDIPREYEYAFDAEQ